MNTITLQYYLNKLISEEVLAFETYKVLMLSFQKNIKLEKSIIDMLDDIAEDEYSDHAKKLIEFCRKNELNFPTDNAAYLRHASEAAVSLFNNIPNTDDNARLISYAMQLERDAINSYQEAIVRGLESPEFTEEIMSILSHNLKDEEQHLEDLEISFAACENNF